MKVTYDGHGRLYHDHGLQLRSVTSILKLVEKDMSFLKNAAKYHEIRNPHYPWDQYTKDARDCGTYLHYFIGAELAVENNLPEPEFEPTSPVPDISYQDKNGVTWNRRENYQVSRRQWYIFKKMAHPTIVGSGLEKFVWHSTGFAGRLDSVMYLDVANILKEKREMNIDAPLIKFLDKTKIDNNTTWLVDFKSSKATYSDYPAQCTAYMIAWNERVPKTPIDRLGILRMNAETGWEFREVEPDFKTWNRAMKKARELGIVK